MTSSAIPFPEEKDVKFSSRTRARLVVVQALFEQKFNKFTAQQVIERFQNHQLHQPSFPSPRLVDMKLFRAIILGIAEDTETINTLIAENLDEKWTLDRLDPVLLNICQAGTFELIGMPDTPTPVIINEYINVTKAFLNKKEQSFTNKLLDSVAKVSRS